MADSGADDLQQVVIALDGGSGTDEVEVAGLTGQLRRQLLDLDVESVEGARGGDVPAGAKPVDPAAVGALVVTLAIEVLPSVVAAVERWLADRPVRGVKLTIGGDSLEIGNVSEATERRLVEAFLERHAGT